MRKSTVPLDIPNLPEIDYNNPSIATLLQINYELKKAYLQLRTRSVQQNVNLTKISKEKQQLSREFYKLEVSATLPPSKDFQRISYSKSPKIIRNETPYEKNEKNEKNDQNNNPNQRYGNNESVIESIETQDKSTKAQEASRKSGDSPDRVKMSSELELVYRERLNESEKLKEKYLTKYKNYKQKYPKQDYSQFKGLVEEKEKEVAKLLEEKTKIEEEMKKIMSQLHECKQETYRLTEENNHLRKEFFDMERKNELLMEELSVMASQNDELITENGELKELLEKKDKEINELKSNGTNS